VNPILFSPCVFRGGGTRRYRSRLVINEQLGVNLGAERPENNQRFAAPKVVFRGVFGLPRAKSLIIFRGVEIGVEKRDTTMTYFARKTRRVSSRRATAKPRLEPLEERQLLSGFGSADGAYIVEPWAGTYQAVQIQPGTGNQIVAAGTMDITNPTIDHRMAIARYDSAGNPDSNYGSGGVSAPPLGPGTEYGFDLVLQPADGKAVVSGTGSGGFVAARFNTNGTLDGSFGTGGWNTLDALAGDSYNPAYGVGLQSTGKVVAAGFSLGTK